MASHAVRAHARAGRNSTPRNAPPQNTPPRNASSQDPPPQPSSNDKSSHGHRYTITQRVQCLTLQAEGFSRCDIEKKTGVKPSAQTFMKQKAFDRGFRPDQDPRILDIYVEDGARSGRPKEITPEIEQALLDSVRADRAGREKSSEVLAYERDISYSSALRILHKHGLSNVKPTRKPGLNSQQRAARLAFCLEHQHWTLEDWKRVIWSDETSVILGQRRGTVRVWRNTGEAYDRSVIRHRWKGFSEFMFWGCFSWDKKGPCHIWTTETAAERKESEKELAILNETFEEALKTEWELSTGVRRMNLRRRPPGPKPKWRFTKANGKLVREGNAGGIDWYRYWKLILLSKVIPFVKECQKDRLDTLIQEDNASSHAHHHTRTVYALYDIQRLLWPGNSPDLNAIEPAWFWLKRRTTALGAPTNRTDIEKAWYQAWKDLPQEQIQQWIAAIPFHIQEIIRLEGGNEYKEGVQGFKRSWAGTRIKGKLSTLRFIDRKTQHQDLDRENSDNEAFVDPDYEESWEE